MTRDPLKLQAKKKNNVDSLYHRDSPSQKVVFEFDKPVVLLKLNYCIKNHFLQLKILSFFSFSYFKI